MQPPMREAVDDVSPSLHFRELDDEFMQKQAKVWLEAVLEERYGDAQCLGELLADGQLLFRVSKCFKAMLRTRLGEDAALPDTPLDAKGGKYLPYSRVDAFLKICKRVGLPDVDLFTPPDVVEKKDLRRVCSCIRALSRKARAKRLEVPDFDKVAHTVAMPTQKVGGLRLHLQQASSQFNPSRPNASPASPPTSPQAQAEAGTSEDKAVQAAEPAVRTSRQWLPLPALGALTLAVTASVLLALKPGRKAKIVEVREGDTLSKISRRCGKSSWRELVELNPRLIANPDLIHPAERLKLG